MDGRALSFTHPGKTRMTYFNFRSTRRGRVQRRPSQDAFLGLFRKALAHHDPSNAENGASPASKRLSRRPQNTRIRWAAAAAARPWCCTLVFLAASPTPLLSFRPRRSPVAPGSKLASCTHMQAWPVCSGFYLFHYSCCCCGYHVVVPSRPTVGMFFSAALLTPAGFGCPAATAPSYSSAVPVAGKLWLLGEDLEGVEHMDDRGDESLQLSIVKAIKGECR